MVAQAEHIPVHLGAMPESVAAVIGHNPSPGDLDGEIVAYAYTRTHHSDVGGITPGSMPAGSTSIWQEGLVVPPVRLDDGVLRVILANVRTPELRRADLAAQAAANRLGGERLAEL